MKNSKIEKGIKVGQKVAKFVDRAETECYTGIVKAKKENKALVYFSTRFLSRWCNISNLHPVIQK